MLTRKVRALALFVFVSLSTAPPTAAQAADSRAAAARPDTSAVRDAVRAFADWVDGRGGRASARVMRVDTGAILADASPELALNPASNMKIVTAAVALSRLGSEYCFSTGLYGRIEGTRVDPLVLRGSGDPSLSSADLWQLARTLRQLGVTEVGALLVDQRRFDAQFVPPAFEQQPDEWASFRAPISALALDRNSVTLNVLPTAEGQPARVWFEPAGIVTIEGSIETKKPGTGDAVQLTLEARGPDLVARVGGHVARGLPRLRFERRLDDPRRAAGLALRALLEEAGVRVSGAVALGGETVRERLVFHQSEPLGALLAPVGKQSDNFYAEMLLKVLGAEAGAVPARSEDGARVVLDWLASAGARDAETRIQNGSGLFDANRLSAASLVTVLRRAALDPSIGPEFLAQLAIGGVDGTLRSRFRKLRDARLVRAKTGTLAAAVGLSGYVLGARGQSPLAFSLLANGLPGQAYLVRERMDRVVEAMASLQSSPSDAGAPAATAPKPPEEPPTRAREPRADSELAEPAEAEPE